MRNNKPEKARCPELFSIFAHFLFLPFCEKRLAPRAFPRYLSPPKHETPNGKVSGNLSSLDKKIIQ
jgi:hypothetical protein